MLTCGNGTTDTATVWGPAEARLDPSTASVEQWTRGDFSLGANMGSDSIRPKPLPDVSRNRGLVCAHMHSIARTQKIRAIMSLADECWQQKHTQHTPSKKAECDYLNGWIKNSTPPPPKKKKKNQTKKQKTKTAT